MRPQVPHIIMEVDTDLDVACVVYSLQDMSVNCMLY